LGRAVKINFANINIIKNSPIATSRYTVTK
jgi:hypothetical protein